MGQPRATLLLDEVRKHVEVLSRVLAAIRADVPAGEPVEDAWDKLARELTRTGM